MAEQDRKKVSRKETETESETVQPATSEDGCRNDRKDR